LDKVYYKDKKTGVWKADLNEDIDAGDLVPESYYFDAEEGVFKFKSSQAGKKKGEPEMSMKDKLKAKKKANKARVAPATNESDATDAASEISLPPKQSVSLTLE